MACFTGCGRDAAFLKAVTFGLLIVTLAAAGGSQCDLAPPAAGLLPDVRFESDLAPLLEPAPQLPIGFYDRFGELKTPAEARQIVVDAGLDPNDPDHYLRIGLIHQGFRWRPNTDGDGDGDGDAAALTVVPHHELFRRYTHKRRMRKVAAGRPIERCEGNDQIDLQEIFGPRIGQRANTYALKVEGDSMRDEGILEGDYVLVERRTTASNGEKVVARLPDGETTLKTFYKEAGQIRPQPANPDYDPIYGNDVTIQGVLVGVVRRY